MCRVAVQPLGQAVYGVQSRSMLAATAAGGDHQRHAQRRAHGDVMITAHPANSGAAVDINPASAIYANARYQPDSVAIRYPGGDLTYAQLNDRGARLAAVLTDRGVTGVDRVAYLGLNSPAFLVTMFAAFRLGAIFVPVNFRLAGPELQAVLLVVRRLPRAQQSRLFGG
jgi:non-ribosomal peptide synthetase component F